MKKHQGDFLATVVRGTFGRRVSAVFFALGLLSAAVEVQAEAMRIYGMSADAMARGEAVVASGNDASTIWYNPAGMSALNSMDASLTLNNMWLYGENTVAGKKEKSKKTYFTPFGAYYAAPVTEAFAAGLGINTPFGLATEYDKNASFRYITTGGEIQVVNIQPTVSYKILPNLSAGAGVNYYLSSAELTQQYSWAPAAVALSNPALALSPDSSAKVKGTGDGVGFTAGLQFRPSEKHALGVTYHSQVNVKYDGDARLKGIPGGVQALFSGAPDYKSDSRFSVRFPDIVAVGYAVRPTEKLTWEVGGHWTNWNDVKTIDVNLNQPTALFPNSSNALYWKNAWAVKTGAEYAVSEKWAFSGGYFYNKSPMRESTYTPLVADGDHHVVSAGARYNAGKSLVIRLPIVGIFQKSQTVNSNTSDLLGNQIDGKYTLAGYQIGISGQWMFGL